MRNPTNEYMLPVSYGLEEHLPKFGCNLMTVYLWFHFHKTVKGKAVGQVTFRLEDISEHFGVSKAFIAKLVNQLVQIGMIEFLYKSRSKWKANVIYICKNKSFGDFTVFNRKRYGDGKVDSKIGNVLQNNPLETPKDVNDVSSSTDSNDFEKFLGQLKTILTEKGIPANLGKLCIRLEKPFRNYRRETIQDAFNKAITKWERNHHNGDFISYALKILREDYVPK